MTDDGQLLMDYACRGDVSSLSTLVVRHAKWLTAFLRGFAPCDADAEDLLQDVWVRVIRNCGSYRGGSVKAYLVRIARSVAIDRFRRSRPTLSVDVADETGGTLAETLVDGALTPVERYESKATAADVRAAVRTLPDGPRDVLLLRIEGEMPFKEIAETMGIPLGTALTWMHVATLRLKKILGNAK